LTVDRSRLISLPWRYDMPFAKKFRAMMDFPFHGDRIGAFTVESVDVHDEPHVVGQYVYSIRMVLQGPGGQQGVRRALRPLFSRHPATFSAYGNPYQLWCMRPEIQSLGDRRYAVTAQGGGARIYLKEELNRFLAYVDGTCQLSTPLDPATRETLVEAYLTQYQAEIRRKVNRYRSRLRRAEDIGS
jgi:hypothetical protein